MTLLVTGGAGFIGSNFVLEWIRLGLGKIINLDKLTYAGNLDNLVSLRNRPEHLFIRGDIGDRELVSRIFREHDPEAVVNFAAESHVDRSIHAPDAFIQTNVVGLFTLLREAQEHWKKLPSSGKSRFRFIQISTDEVYGSLGPDDPPFTEGTAYRPNSPYAASKAAADHLVRSFFKTYAFPAMTTNCSNNYGPFQYPEKFIPLAVLKATREEAIPVYGEGKNIRDWLYVTDHCRAIRLVLEKGRIGETYNIGGTGETDNLALIRRITGLLDRIAPRRNGSYSQLVTFVPDRPGHDFRYAMNASKIAGELGWRAEESLETGLEKTVRWILDHSEWMSRILNGSYQEWIETNYGARN